MNDKISVIIPIYNAEKSLCRCIDSVIAQTYTNLEIIMVDDGSPDRCGEICDEYAKRDNRIKVIHKENGGLSDARNSGIEAATGEYIGFVDSDDYIRKDMYEKLYDAILTEKADISICGYKRINESGDILRTNHLSNSVYMGTDVLNNHLMNHWECWVVSWNKLYNIKLFKSIRFPKGKLHEDSFIVHKLFYQSKRIVCIEDECYYYILHSNSIQGRKYNYQRLDDVEACYDRMEFYIDNRLSLKMLINIFYFSVRLLNKSYLSDSKKNPEFEQCYKRLNRQYRRIFKKLVKCNIGIKSKLVMICHYISPYLTCKIGSIIKSIAS